MASDSANRSYETRFFTWREVREAAQFAADGGIAIHRNFDVDGMKIGIRERSGPSWHVMGTREALLEWGRQHRMNPRWIQPPPRGLGERFPTVWHFDVFGALARRFEREAAQTALAIGN